ncbi:MAG: M20 family metallopeptidase [Blautia sp.]
MKYVEKAVELTKKLIAIESSNPGKLETAVGDFLYQRLQKTADLAERMEVQPGRYNLRAKLQGGKEGPELIFICHMDTVTIGEGWIKPPLKAREEDGRIYGRGACDMKSGLACALAAFEEAAGWERPFLRTLTLILTVDEEGAMAGVEKALEAGWIKENDYVLDMEPTDGKIRVSHKGRIWFLLEVQGVTAHASTPWKGADAIAAAAEMISYIRKRVSDTPVHKEMGGSTVTFGMIEGGYQPYVVPDRCKVTIDMRLAPPMDGKAAAAVLQEAIAYGEAQVQGCRGSFEITGEWPYVEKDESSALLAALKKAVQDMGEEPYTDVFPGYTDTAVIAGRLGNSNCMSYGPGDLEAAHKPDEYVPIKDIDRCVRVLVQLEKNLMTGNRHRKTDRREL